MRDLRTMLSATRGRGRFDWTDWFTYGYLLLGVLLMFGPVLWLVLSSFKTAAALNEFPPRLLPYGQKSVSVPGRSTPAPVYRVKLPDGETRELAELRRIGIQATMVDPAWSRP
jgi:alpha-1,4-digalacturonate transport system permease protein